MMNSLSGEAVYIDLCAAKDKKLFVQINAQGQHPFQGKGIYFKNSTLKTKFNLEKLFTWKQNIDVETSFSTW